MYAPYTTGGAAYNPYSTAGYSPYTGPMMNTATGELVTSQFAALDRNGDGVVSNQEMSQPQYYSTPSTSSYYSQQYASPMINTATGEVVTSQFATMDQNGDGFVDGGELARSGSNTASFATMDQNGDGLLTGTEMSSGYPTPSAYGGYPTTSPYGGYPGTTTSPAGYYPTSTPTGMSGMSGMSGMLHAGHDMSTGGFNPNAAPMAGHDFVHHVGMLGLDSMLAQGQQSYGGWSWNADGSIDASSPITGLTPVIAESYREALEENPDATGQELESLVANKLTGNNDWEQLEDQTQQEIMRITGVDFENMDEETREKTLNHVLHSPLPFGDLGEIPAGTQINMGFTHTLDKDDTLVEDLGNGKFKISMISNNNNGSHTGHNLGSFTIDLGPGATAEQAKEVGNDMINNDNNNDKLSLDPAAYNYLKSLYGYNVFA
jgi:hypothetical protein